MSYILKLQGGSNLWYLNIIDYDPTKYTREYDTSRLFNGDTEGIISGTINTGSNPWSSNIAGYDSGRYTPTSGYGAFGVNNPHFNYTKGVEGLKYYQNFTNDLLDSNSNFTDMGLAWAKAVDKLLPAGSKASFFDENGKLRTSWITGDNDAHRRGIIRNFTNLKDYVNQIRNDQILGARHNVFLLNGKRYFYTDKDGNRHWVSPEEAQKYTISKDPVELGWEGTTYWNDYEITGPGNATTPGNDSTDGTQAPIGHRDGYGFDWNKIKEGALKIFGNPDLYAIGRLAGTLYGNEKIYNEQLKGIRPTLLQTYNTHRQVVGDEATKQAYYRRAALGLTRASRPFTSDADRQMAYLFEAKRIGDELRAQGDLADNLEIRRTSDESNQHQWENTKRATEVANTNIASINQARAAKHQLLALKHSAQFSTIDNFLKGIEYRKRLQLAEEQAFEDLIFTLQQQLDLLTNPKILEAKKKFQNVINAHTKDGNVDWNNDEVINALLEYKRALYQASIDQLNKRREYYLNRHLLNFLKSGSKITYKKKDDLLYKSTRDVVEHFRKMSKLSDDSNKKKEPKILSLNPHPRKSRKYQYGGTAPFLIYTPVALSGERSTTYSSETSSAKSSKEKDSKNETLDMIKELFKLVGGKGLPSDVNSLYMSMLNFLNRARAFGEDISTEDIASMYLSNMQKLNLIEYLKANYDNAEKTAIANDAINEIAVDFAGHLVCLDKDTREIKYVKSILDARDLGLIPLTNGLLLLLRATDLSLAGRLELDTIVANGVGMTKIADFLKSQLPKLGASENTIEGYTKKGTNDIINGLRLLQEAPEGEYLYTQYTKELKHQVDAALNYLRGILPNNMKRVLETRAELGGLPVDKLIASLVGSGVSAESKIELKAVTGRGAKDKDENSKEGGVKSNPIMQMILELGGIPRTWEIITKDSNIKISVNGTYYSLIPKVTEDMSIDKMLSESGISGILDSKQGITFGDLNISPDLLKDIMYSNSGGMIVTLPCKIVNGHKEVNLGVKKSYEEAILEIESKGISKTSPEYNKILGEILKQKGLNSLLDSNGYPDKTKFSQFLVVEAYATSKVKQLDPSSQYLEKVKNPDELLEQRLIKALSTDDKKSDYSLDIDYWFWGDDVYRGSVFIPLTNNINASINAWGDLIKIDESRELENKFLNFNKVSAMKSSNSSVL